MVIVGSSSSSSDGSGVHFMIFPAIAVMLLVGIVVLIIFIIVKKKINTSTQQTPATAPVYDTIDKPPLNKNELKSPIYSTPYELSCDEHTIKSTDKVLYAPVSSPSHTTNDIELQQNPAYAVSANKVIMDNNPAYGVLK